MLKVKDTGQFKKDYKKCIKRGYDLQTLKNIVSILAIPEPLAEKIKCIISKGIMKDSANATFPQTGY